ncbi:MAG: hypothetical protein H7126_13900 [Candidatus Parcubacteria bacterium]|nr:hypothetical protein [Leptolyngbyaceae cyanobacterium LF-bin-113]
MRRGAANSELRATGETIAIAIKSYVDRALADQVRYQGIFDGAVTDDPKKNQAKPSGIFDGISLNGDRYQGIFDSARINQSG